MNDATRWSLDQDPPRDEALARLLREAEGPPAETGMDWERLHAAVMRRVAPATRPVTGAPREWLDVVVQWRRVAAAASVAAILGAGALLWSGGLGSSDADVDDETAPESVALARVVADYPDDAVFTSMIQAARTDEFTGWSDR